MHSFLFEVASNLETIKTQANAPHILNRWEKLATGGANALATTRFFNSLAQNYTQGANQLMWLALIIYGVYLINNLELTIGALIAVNQLSSRILSPISTITNVLARWYPTKIAQNALDNMMQLPLEQTIASPLKRPALSGEITLDRVTFRYDSHGLPALNDINLTIKAGEKLAILGSSGSGKSTLARILLGLYQPETGMVLYDKRDSRQLSPIELRQQYGFARQEPCLFEGTLRANIIAGRFTLTDEQILSAATVAGVDDFVRRLPMGYDIPVG